MSHAIRGLYAVTPDESDTAALVERVRAALVGGAGVVQYRNKRASPAVRREQARALCELCRAFGVPFIINDHIELALEVDADGLHLGAEDGSVAAARTRLGAGRLLGASCYDCLELAERAVREGADHVAFGSFFPSPVKPGAVKAPLTLLGRARLSLQVPVVAIGGITTANGGELVRAGAGALAVITALFGAQDIEQAARDFNALFIPGTA